MTETVSFLSVADAQLEYRWIGPPATEAPVLIFLHEGLGCVSRWRDFPDRAAAALGLPALVYSRRGYGRSSACPAPWPLDYLHREAERMLPAVLDALNISSAILVGHSDGATIALIHACGPDASRLRGIALMAPHSFVEDVCIEGVARAAEAYRQGDLRRSLARHHGERVDDAFQGWNGTWLNPDFRRWDIRPDLSRITVPVLVIQGEQDEYATHAQVDAVAEGVSGPVQILMLPQCRHSPHRDQPEAVIEALRGWWESVS